MDLTDKDGAPTTGAEQVAALVAEIRRIIEDQPDTASRLVMADQMVGAWGDGGRELGRFRRAYMRELEEAGYSRNSLAELLDMSKQRVHQLLDTPVYRAHQRRAAARKDGT